jgi:hypothetical protein
MEIWTGAAFMKPTESVAVAGMLEAAGFDGVDADHYRASIARFAGAILAKLR